MQQKPKRTSFGSFTFPSFTTSILSTNSTTSSNSDTTDNGSSKNLKESVKEGVLKFKGYFSTWKNYNFVLKDRKLSMLKKRGSKFVLKREYDLTKNCRVFEAQNLTSKKYSFCIVFEKKETIFLQANSEEEMKDWIKQIKQDV